MTEAVEDAVFYCLFRTVRNRQGEVIRREFVSARKTKPEPGVLRVSTEEAWVEVRAYVPSGVFLKNAHRVEPCGMWAAPIPPPPPSEFATL